MAGLEVKSFELLLSVVLISLALIPKLMLSISFWFSIVGVLYIFLILHHSEMRDGYRLSALISILIFLLMLPNSTHNISPNSRLQLISPVLLFYLAHITLSVLNLLSTSFGNLGGLFWIGNPLLLGYLVLPKAQRSLGRHFIILIRITH